MRLVVDVSGMAKGTREVYRSQERQPCQLEGRDWEDSHDKRQKHIPRNLRLSRRVNLRIAHLGEEVVRGITRDEAVNLEFYRSPVPEPACTYGKDNAWDPEGPDDEVDGNVDARVDGFARAVGDFEPEDQRVVKEAEDDL